MNFEWAERHHMLQPAVCAPNFGYAIEHNAVYTEADAHLALESNGMDSQRLDEIYTWFA